MINQSITAPSLDIFPVKQKRVYFDAATTLYEGMGVCYDADRTDEGAATAVITERATHVELPSTGNNEAFAGVASKTYAGVTGGQWITINEPGSYCNVRVSVSATIGSHYTCLVGTGDFGLVGFHGKGTIKALQTADGSSSDTLCFAYLEDGPQSGLQHVFTVAEMTTGGALTTTPTGCTSFNAATVGTAAAITLANGTVFGQRKSYNCLGTLASNAAVITVTSGVQLDGSTALATITQNAANEEDILEWGGVTWKLVHHAASALA